MPFPRLLPLIPLLAAGAVIAETAPEVPKGTVTKHVFEGSRIFPGTTRDYWVYVPQQYDPAKPACVYVNQDGIQFHAPEVFDQLIAAKEMPVTVGIFIMHGHVKAPSDAALDRWNRSYEYDGLGDGYARFVLDELIPHVVADQHLALSTSGNDRAIGGSSSGAVCAFTAAWERPDAFTRVFSSIGTYVGLRGGNEYATLLRKVEPKPLRVFLQDGSGDLNIYAGDWWMANQAMERALIFSGYEVEHAWGEGGHNGDHATKIFPEAMRFLWKGWPTPVKTGLGSNQLKDILIPNENWQLVGEGYGFTEGPAVDAKGDVVFNDVPKAVTYRLGADGKPVELRTDNQNADGMAYGPDGRLYAVLGATKQVVAYAADGTATVLADGFRGNDIVVNHDGGMYVTEPGWDGTKPSNVWYISPKGEKRIVDTGLKFANGVTLSPDQSLLYVVDSRSHWVYSYQVQADGTLAHKQRYYDLHRPENSDEAWGDGMRVDRDGRLYVCTNLGLQICDQAGRVNCILPMPNGHVSNMTFGGPDLDIIYATCNNAVYKRKVKVHGYEAFTTPIKPKAPGL
ncbi:MAG: SMP-30/gluconolactonase/LRE family protein [Planctomycetes bacterium]|nr:SMP-30/gluconolactonase/LRE family protein [Planctomycetota bacterium]